MTTPENNHQKDPLEKGLRDMIAYREAWRVLDEWKCRGEAVEPDAVRQARCFIIDAFNGSI